MRLVFVISKWLVESYIARALVIHVEKNMPSSHEEILDVCVHSSMGNSKRSVCWLLNYGGKIVEDFVICEYDND